MIMLIILGLNTQTSTAAVTQQIGFYDTQYINIINNDCLSCHGGNTSDRHHTTYKAVYSDCSSCHLKDNNGKLEVIRDCRSCHYLTAHHKSSLAVSGECSICHTPQVVSSFIYNPGTFNPPSIVAPAQCRNCHNGNTTSIPPINETRDTHHDLGMTCQTCHNADSTTSIRLCEQCHQPATLHTLHANNCGSCHLPGNPAQLPPAVPLPSIVSISAYVGMPGDSLIVNGFNFGIIQGNVKIGFNNAPVVSWEQQSITVIIPYLNSGTYDVAVVNNNGTSNIKGYNVAKGVETVITEMYGMPDKLYLNLVEADCRNCHANTVDRHHTSKLLCNSCHQVINNILNTTRDCKTCHTTGPHHVTQIATGGKCATCHSNQIISNLYEVPKSLIVPDTTTPTPKSCSNCHITPRNSYLHHDTELSCDMCHENNELYPIRTCQNCHSRTTLHNIGSHFKPQNCVGCHAARPNQFPEFPAGKPEITSLSTNSGLIGSTFIIEGKNFGLLADKGKVFFDIYNGQIVSWTDVSVEVRVPNLPVGNYLVTVENQAGKSNGQNFTIGIPGSLTGVVRKGEGEPLKQALVTIGTQRTLTNDNGIYKIKGISAQTYNVTVSKREYQTATQTVTILDNVETKADFVLKKNEEKEDGKFRQFPWR